MEGGREGVQGRGVGECDRGGRGGREGGREGGKEG